MERKQMPGPKKEVPAKHWDAMFAPSSCAAIITTVDGVGNVNAATFGTCTRIMHDPLHVLFATTSDPRSDTFTNTQENGQFVVNPLSLDERLLEKARIAALPFRTGVNELDRAGLTAAPSAMVVPPRVAECRSHFECEVVWTKKHLTRSVVCGIVVAVAIDDDCYDPRGVVRLDNLRPVHYAGAPYGGNFVAAYEARWADRPYDGPPEWRDGVERVHETPNVLIDDSLSVEFGGADVGGSYSTTER
jgi:flavin reductase (DIM6/NTAB) family NADH-FMN oxidoreductase RutF